MLEVVDPHVHLWDLWTRLYPHFERPKKGGMNAAICRSYLLDEFLDEGKGQISIIGAVHVEAFPTDPVKETATLQNVADARPIPIVMVAGGDLSSPDFVQMLDEHAAFPILRGVRQVLNRHADTRFNYVDRNIMDDPHFVVGLHELGTRGLTFDLQLYPHRPKPCWNVDGPTLDGLARLEDWITGPGGSTEHQRENQRPRDARSRLDDGEYSPARARDHRSVWRAPGDVCLKLPGRQANVYLSWALAGFRLDHH